MKIKRLFLIFYLTLTVCDSFVEVDLPRVTKSVLESDNPFLIKLLQSVDEAPSNEYLLDVTLKLLKSLCVCMRETLREKQRNLSFNGETNTLFFEDNSHEDDAKVLDLYKTIYNKTCFNLQKDLIKHNLTDNDNLNCGKGEHLSGTTSTVLNYTNKNFNKNELDLKTTLFKSLILTRRFHNYTVKRQHLFKKHQDSISRTASNGVIFSITFYPESNKNKSVESNTAEDLDYTLFSNSAIEITIITTKPTQERNKYKKILNNNVSECNLQSLYTFLTENEKKNLTKKFRILKERGPIRLYVETLVKDKSDYINMCCHNKTRIPECEQITLVEDVHTDNKSAKTLQHYKDTISKIKNLVKLYKKRVEGKQKLKDKMYIINSIIEDPDLDNNYIKPDTKKNEKKELVQIDEKNIIQTMDVLLSSTTEYLKTMKIDMLRIKNAMNINSNKSNTNLNSENNKFEKENYVTSSLKIMSPDNRDKFPEQNHTKSDRVIVAKSYDNTLTLIPPTRSTIANNTVSQSSKSAYKLNMSLSFFTNEIRVNSNTLMPETTEESQWIKATINDTTYAYTNSHKLNEIEETSEISQTTEVMRSLSNKSSRISELEVLKNVNESTSNHIPYKIPKKKEKNYSQSDDYITNIFKTTVKTDYKKNKQNVISNKLVLTIKSLNNSENKNFNNIFTKITPNVRLNMRNSTKNFTNSIESNNTVEKITVKFHPSKDKNESKMTTTLVEKDERLHKDDAVIKTKNIRESKMTTKMVEKNTQYVNFIKENASVKSTNNNESKMTTNIIEETMQIVSLNKGVLLKESTDNRSNNFGVSTQIVNLNKGISTITTKDNNKTTTTTDDSETTTTMNNNKSETKPNIVKKTTHMVTLNEDAETTTINDKVSIMITNKVKNTTKKVIPIETKKKPTINIQKNKSKKGVSTKKVNTKVQNKKTVNKSALQQKRTQNWKKATNKKKHYKENVLFTYSVSSTTESYVFNRITENINNTGALYMANVVTENIKPIEYATKTVMTSTSLSKIKSGTTDFKPKEMTKKNVINKNDIMNNSEAILMAFTILPKYKSEIVTGPTEQPIRSTINSGIQFIDVNKNTIPIKEDVESTSMKNNVYTGKQLHKSFPVTNSLVYDENYETEKMLAHIKLENPTKLATNFLEFHSNKHTGELNKDIKNALETKNKSNPSSPKENTYNNIFNEMTTETRNSSESILEKYLDQNNVVTESTIPYESVLRKQPGTCQKTTPINEPLTNQNLISSGIYKNKTTNVMIFETNKQKIEHTISEDITELTANPVHPSNDTNKPNENSNINFKKVLETNFFSFSGINEITTKIRNTTESLLSYQNNIVIDSTTPYNSVLWQQSKTPKLQTTTQNEHLNNQHSISDRIYENITKNNIFETEERKYIFTEFEDTTELMTNSIEFHPSKYIDKLYKNSEITLKKISEPKNQSYLNINEIRTQIRNISDFFLDRYSDQNNIVIESTTPYNLVLPKKPVTTKLQTTSPKNKTLNNQHSTSDGLYKNITLNNIISETEERKFTYTESEDTAELMTNPAEFYPKKHTEELYKNSVITIQKLSETKNQYHSNINEITTEIREITTGIRNSSESFLDRYSDQNNFAIESTTPYKTALSKQPGTTKLQITALKNKPLNDQHSISDGLYENITLNNIISETGESELTYTKSEDPTEIKTNPVEFYPSNHIDKLYKNSEITIKKISQTKNPSFSNINEITKEIREITTGIRNSSESFLDRYSDQNNIVIESTTPYDSVLFKPPGTTKLQTTTTKNKPLNDQSSMSNRLHENITINNVFYETEERQYTHTKLEDITELTKNPIELHLSKHNDELNKNIKISSSKILETKNKIYSIINEITTEIHNSSESLLDKYSDRINIVVESTTPYNSVLLQQQGSTKFQSISPKNEHSIFDGLHKYITTNNVIFETEERKYAHTEVTTPILSTHTDEVNKNSENTFKKISETNNQSYSNIYELTTNIRNSLELNHEKYADQNNIVIESTTPYKLVLQQYAGTTKLQTITWKNEPINQYSISRGLHENKTRNNVIFEIEGKKTAQAKLNDITELTTNPVEFYSSENIEEMYKNIKTTEIRNSSESFLKNYADQNNFTIENTTPYQSVLWQQPRTPKLLTITLDNEHKNNLYKISDGTHENITINNKIFETEKIKLAHTKLEETKKITTKLLELYPNKHKNKRKITLNNIKDAKNQFYLNSYKDNISPIIFKKMTTEIHNYSDSTVKKKSNKNNNKSVLSQQTETTKLQTALKPKIESLNHEYPISDRLSENMTEERIFAHTKLNDTKKFTTNPIELYPNKNIDELNKYSKLPLNNTGISDTKKQYHSNSYKEHFSHNIFKQITTEIRSSLESIKKIYSDQRNVTLESSTPYNSVLRQQLGTFKLQTTTPKREPLNNQVTILDKFFKYKSIKSEVLNNGNHMKKFHDTHALSLSSEISSGENDPEEIISEKINVTMQQNDWSHELIENKKNMTDLNLRLTRPSEKITQQFYSKNHRFNPKSSTYILHNNLALYENIKSYPKLHVTTKSYNVERTKDENFITLNNMTHKNGTINYSNKLLKLRDSIPLKTLLTKDITINISNNNSTSINDTKITNTTNSTSRTSLFNKTNSVNINITSSINIKHSEMTNIKLQKNTENQNSLINNSKKGKISQEIAIVSTKNNFNNVSELPRMLQNTILKKQRKSKVSPLTNIVESVGDIFMGKSSNVNPIEYKLSTLSLNTDIETSELLQNISHTLNESENVPILSVLEQFSAVTLPLFSNQNHDMQSTIGKTNTVDANEKYSQFNSSFVSEDELVNRTNDIEYLTENYISNSQISIPVTITDYDVLVDITEQETNNKIYRDTNTTYITNINAHSNVTNMRTVLAKTFTYGNLETKYNVTINSTNTIHMPENIKFTTKTYEKNIPVLNNEITKRLDVTKTTITPISMFENIPFPKLRHINIIEDKYSTTNEDLLTNPVFLTRIYPDIAHIFGSTTTSHNKLNESIHMISENYNSSIVVTENINKVLQHNFRTSSNKTETVTPSILLHKLFSDIPRNSNESSETLTRYTSTEAYSAMTSVQDKVESDIFDIINNKTKQNVLSYVLVENITETIYNNLKNKKNLKPLIINNTDYDLVATETLNSEETKYYTMQQFEKPSSITMVNNKNIDSQIENTSHVNNTYNNRLITQGHSISRVESIVKVKPSRVTPYTNNEDIVLNHSQKLSSKLYNSKNITHKNLHLTVEQLLTTLSGTYKTQKKTNLESVIGFKLNKPITTPIIEKNKINIDNIDLNFQTKQVIPPEMNEITKEKFTASKTESQNIFPMYDTFTYLTKAPSTLIYSEELNNSGSGTNKEAYTYTKDSNQILNIVDISKIPYFNETYNNQSASLTYVPKPIQNDVNNTIEIRGKTKSNNKKFESMPKTSPWILTNKTKMTIFALSSSDKIYHNKQSKGKYGHTYKNSEQTVNKNYNKYLFTTPMATTMFQNLKSTISNDIQVITTQYTDFIENLTKSYLTLNEKLYKHTKETKTKSNVYKSDKESAVSNTMFTSAGNKDISSNYYPLSTRPVKNEQAIELTSKYVQNQTHKNIITKDESQISNIQNDDDIKVTKYFNKILSDKQYPLTDIYLTTIRAETEKVIDKLPVSKYINENKNAYNETKILNKNSFPINKLKINVTKDKIYTNILKSPISISRIMIDKDIQKYSAIRKQYQQIEKPMELKSTNNMQNSTPLYVKNSTKNQISTVASNNGMFNKVVARFKITPNNNITTYEISEIPEILKLSEVKIPKMSDQIPKVVGIDSNLSTITQNVPIIPVTNPYLKSQIKCKFETSQRPTTDAVVKEDKSTIPYTVQFKDKQFSNEISTTKISNTFHNKCFQSQITNQILLPIDIFSYVPLEKSNTFVKTPVSNDPPMIYKESSLPVESQFYQPKEAAKIASPFDIPLTVSEITEEKTIKQSIVNIKNKINNLTHPSIAYTKNQNKEKISAAHSMSKTYLELPMTDKILTSFKILSHNSQTTAEIFDITEAENSETKGTEKNESGDLNRDKMLVVSNLKDTNNAKAIPTVTLPFKNALLTTSNENVNNAQTKSLKDNQELTTQSYSYSNIRQKSYQINTKKVMTLHDPKISIIVPKAKSNEITNSKSNNFNKADRKFKDPNIYYINPTKSSKKIHIANHNNLNETIAKPLNISEINKLKQIFRHYVYFNNQSNNNGNFIRVKTYTDRTDKYAKLYKVTNKINKNSATYSTKTITTVESGSMKKIKYNTFKPISDEEIDYSSENSRTANNQWLFNQINSWSKIPLIKNTTACELIYNLSQQIAKTMPILVQLLTATNCTLVDELKTLYVTESQIIKPKVTNPPLNKLITNTYTLKTSRIQRKQLSLLDKTKLFPVNEKPFRRVIWGNKNNKESELRIKTTVTQQQTIVPQTYVTKKYHEIPRRPTTIDPYTYKPYRKQLKVYRELMPPKSIFSQPYIPKMPPMQIMPRQRNILLRPKFQGTDPKEFKVNRYSPKPLLRDIDVGFYREDFGQHHKPSLSWRDRVKFLQGILHKKNSKTSDEDTEPVLESPHIPDLAMKKPKFLRDRINSIRNYVYSADFSKTTARAISKTYFFSPEFSDLSKEEEVIGPLPEMLDFRRNLQGIKEVATTSAVPINVQNNKKTRRIPRTIFFLSPTIPYNRYF